MTQQSLSYDAVNLLVLGQVPVDVTAVLDVGCGTGRFGEALSKRGGISVTGITWSSEEAAIAAEVLSAVIVADLNTFSFEAAEVFQCVICSHVLEHLCDPVAVLRRLATSIAPGGCIIIALPNVLHWKQRLQFFRGKFRYTDGGIMDSTHLRFFDWTTARELPSKAGYEVVRVASEGCFPLGRLRRWLPKALSGAIDRSAVRWLPGLLASQFVIVGRPQRGSAV
ncbi:class I SAM-dependent methyltransferase [Verrucomicrobiota bacterium sgz303538]